MLESQQYPSESRSSILPNHEHEPSAIRFKVLALLPKLAFAVAVDVDASRRRFELEVTTASDDASLLPALAVGGGIVGR